MPAITAAGYRLIAASISAEIHATLPAESTAVCGPLARLTVRLADALQTDNPRFDRAQFLAASGVSESRPALEWHETDAEGTGHVWYTLGRDRFSIEHLPNGYYRLYHYGPGLSDLHGTLDAAKRAAEQSSRPR